MSKTRINLYLDERLGEAFKRFCRSHRLSYSEVMERIIYRYLISPQSKAPSESNLTAVQSRIHDQAVRAYRQVYDDQRQEVIETAVTDSVNEEVEDVSPQIPIPYPTTSEVNNHGTRTRTNRLSKRQERC